MSRVLILPDVHDKIHIVRKIIENESFDRLISLGDWFDSFDGGIIEARQTAQFVKNLAAKLGREFIWIIANHDICYLFPHQTHNYYCSGFTHGKQKAILFVLKWQDVERNLRVAYEYNNIIFSHAGCHPYHFEHPILGISAEGIIKKCDWALNDLKICIENPLFHAGISRGGNQTVGGVTWADWHDDFMPVQSVSQIVGHTFVKYPEIIIQSGDLIQEYKVVDNEFSYKINDKESFSLNLDTHLNHYVILEDDKLTIKKLI